MNTGLDDRFTSSFRHTRERASPGYYAVTLDPRSPAAIRAQLTATMRTGLARLTYPRHRPANLLINASGATMGTSRANVHVLPTRREVTGTATSGQFCYQGNRYTIHFVARFNRPFASYGTWSGDTLEPHSRAISASIPGPPLIQQPIPGGPSGVRGKGKTAQAGAYIGFDSDAHQAVEARVGISFVSVANARRNLRAESNGTFGELRARARAAWNGMLGRVRVRGGSLANRRLFYTQLYHSLIEPSTFSDANGEYIGFDDRTHRVARGARYADFSGWDTYRSQMPLLAMLAPRRASDMVRSLLAAARQSGYLPKWPQANGHTHVMVGDPADPLIADAWAFGARGFSLRAALRATVKGATRYGKASTQPDYFERVGLPEYKRLGYVPHELNTDSIGATFHPELAWGSASTTLEYALADFSVARLAAARCDRQTYRRFMRRSANWRTLFDSASGYVQPRYANGEFRPVAPSDGEGFVEGSSAQYTLAVPQDPAGLFRALGGRAAARARLDTFFSKLNAGPASAHAFLGNEPTLGTPWLYDWAGEPFKAQAIVRRAMLRLYRASPGGYPGNDDLGSMSSWWVLSALGLYPATPGTDLLAFNSPLFRRAVVRLAGGTLRIDAPRAGPRHPYVHAVELDGHPRTKPWLRFRSLAGGGRLTFALGSRPDRRFGARPSDAPPSYGPRMPLRCARPRGSSGSRLSARPAASPSRGRTPPG
jgi:predicted alpha-1,2-mannosidase